MFSRIFAQKSLGYLMKEKDEHEEDGLARVLTLFDLIMIGIASTVGTGVFVLSGVIAKNDAGPAVIAAWGIAGFACCLTSFAYMELSSLIPSSGSVYAYAYVSLGEVFACIAAWCLTLEYGVSGAAVARSWGSKLAYTVGQIGDLDHSVTEWFNFPYCSSGAAFIQALCTVVLLCGLTLSKQLINWMTMFKIALVIFMTIWSFSAWNSENMVPFVPPSLGAAGLLRGSTAAFFGYIGFDEVCCMAGETVNPLVVMPKAIVGTVVGTALLSGMASLSLVGMVHYSDINAEQGFEAAFTEKGWLYAAYITELGEDIALPIVVFVSFLAQPRLQFAMAKDGLAPQIFGELDDKGNIWWGTVISGVMLTVVAACVPFDNLNDAVSAGVLISFSLCNCCVLNLRYRHASPTLGPSLIGSFTVSALAAALLWTACSKQDTFTSSIGLFGLASLSSAVTVGTLVALWWLCPEGMEPAFISRDFFKSPAMPWLPTCAISLNWFLLAQLSVLGLVLIGVWLSLCLASYFLYGFYHSRSAEFKAAEDYQSLPRQSFEGLVGPTDSFSTTAAHPPFQYLSTKIAGPIDDKGMIKGVGKYRRSFAGASASFLGTEGAEPLSKRNIVGRRTFTEGQTQDEDEDEMHIQLQPQNSTRGYGSTERQD